jgi:hypothetical protein
VYLPELEPQLQDCLRNLRIACKAVQVAIPLGELKLKIKKIEAIAADFSQAPLMVSNSSLLMC